MQESAARENILGMKSTVLHLIDRLLRDQAGEGALHRAEDVDLLARFTGARDEAAFAVLLARHGRLVWAVCRGLLPNDADAEDAFQATFVALFRGSAKIRHAQSLAPWLHTAATRIAKKVRLAAARRRGHERGAAKAEPAPTVVSNETWEALNLAVHDEISRLPTTLASSGIRAVRLGGAPVSGRGSATWRAGRHHLGTDKPCEDRLMSALRARGLTPVVAASALACAAATVSAGVPPVRLLNCVRGQLADGFAPVSNTVRHLASTAAGGTSMTGKWLNAVLIAAALLTATGSVWYANAQQQANTATPAAGEKPAGRERPDETLPTGARFRFGTKREK